MDLAERLRTFINYKGMGISEFADKAGIPRPTLSQLLSGRNKSVNDVFVKRLHSGFPELNIVWLLFDEGEMVSDANFEISEPQNRQFEGPNHHERPERQEINEATFPSLFDRISEQSGKIAPTAHPEGRKTAENAMPPSDQPKATPTERVEAAATRQQEPAAAAEAPKRIKNIMVFYTDNSYEIFHPTPDK